MGWEPEEDKMPIDPYSLSLEVQQALILLNALPDMWDGMNGVWLGKDYAGLGTILDIYEVEDRRAVFDLLQVAETELGKYYQQKQKEQESLAKVKRAR